MKKKTRVYVDGLNFYYRAVKGTPYKWIDLVRLAYRLLPLEHKIDKLLYFTARVSGHVPGAPARQQIYLKALGTLPEVEVHLGSFLAKTIWRPLSNLPVADEKIEIPVPVVLPAGNHMVKNNQQQLLPVGNYPQDGVGKKKRHRKPLPNAVIAEVHTMEEKGSDVNLASHLLNDAWKNLFDVAVVISDDTDLITPIRMVIEERDKPVIVVCPKQRGGAKGLKEVASHFRHVSTSMLEKSQFPDPIRTEIRKPIGW